MTYRKEATKSQAGRVRHQPSIPAATSSLTRSIRVSQFVAAISLTIATIIVFAGTSSAATTIPSPTAGGWQLNGSASLVTSGTPANLQLTAATANEAGSAFWPTAVPGVGISAAFDSSIGSGTGADGLTFTLADASVTSPTALGVDGGGEGFSGIKGIAVSLDTYQNSVNPSANFVGIATGPGPVSDELNYVTTNSSIASLRTGVHHFVVTTFSTGLSVTMDGSQVLTYATSLPPMVLVGFTGGTGGSTDVHAVQNVAITAGPPPAPTVSVVNPTSGPSGTSVNITGTNLTGALAVAFGTTPATTFTVNSSTTITATVPTGSATVDVTVTTAGGTSALNAGDKFTYSAGSSPATIPSPTAGGWQLNGSASLVTSGTPANLQLTAATANEAGSAFWPTAVPGVGISAAFDSSIGSGTGADGLTFTLADASVTSPTALGVDGGGEGFSGIKGIAVSLDTYQNSVNPSANFVGIATGPGPVSDELNYVTTNSSIASLRTGVHHFVVTTFSTGLSVTMDGSQVLTYATSLPPMVLVGFTGGTGGSTDVHAVQNVAITAGPPPAPTVSVVNPTSGPSGTSVNITGTNLTGALAVAFGTTPATTFTVNSSTTITATVPTGSATVDVTVTTAGGTSALNAGDKFTYSASPPTPTLVATYRGDIGRSGYYPAETGLTTANASSLKVHWTDNGGVYSFAQPIVADNMVFWEDWAGSVHGTALTGTDTWKTNVGTTTPPSSQECDPTTAGPTGTPTVATVGSTTVLYVPGGNGAFYALNAQTGAVIWSTPLGSPPNNFLWGSPTLYNGNLYEGIASYGDCPLVQGRLVEMNASTGAVEYTFNTVPNGCTGGGVWGSPTIDTADASIYIDTGNPGCGGSGSLGPSIIKLSASNLSLISSWTVPTSAQAAGDADFGSTPVLFTATIGGNATALVGAVNKNAIFYAFNRANLAAGPVWQSTVATASGDPSVGSIVSAAFDGTNLYIGGGETTINGATCTGSIDALNPATGAFVWRTCQAASMLAGITVVPGVVIEGTLGNSVLFLNAANGTTLYTYEAASQVLGESAVSNGIVYIPVGNGSLVALGQ